MGEEQTENINCDAINSYGQINGKNSFINKKINILQKRFLLQEASVNYVTCFDQIKV